MPDGIRRWSFFRGDSYEHPDGEWVRFSDVQARLEAADARACQILGMLLADAKPTGADLWRVLISGQLKQEAEKALELRHGEGEGRATPETDGRAD